LAATNSTDGSATIKAFAPEREAFLENDLTRLVAELGNRGKPVIALFDGLGLFGNPQIRMPIQQTMAQMQQFFDVKPQVGDIDKLPDNTRIVMIVHPQGLSERTLYTIDQWAVNGGATVVFVDPHAENQMGYGGRPPPDASSDLPKLFKAWGVNYDKKKAVADLKYAIPTVRMVDGRPVQMINLGTLALNDAALNKKEAILGQLQVLLMTTAGSFTAANKDITLRPLVTASPDESGLLDASKIQDRDADLRALASQIEKTKEPAILAARLTGKISSAFTEKPKDSKFAGTHAGKSSKDLNIVLVSDADMLMDRNWVRKQNILGTEVAQAFANNGDFVNNALEQMAGGPALTDLRGRGVSWRPFQTIQAMEAEASKKYSAKEQQLTKKLKDIEAKLTQLSKSGSDKKGAKSSDVLTPEQVKAIEGFKTQLLGTREELRTVQFELRRDVDSLKRWLTLANVAAVPLIAGAIALLIALIRPRKPVPQRRKKGDAIPPGANPEAGSGATTA
ncbi:MAG: Gldg family protein, partial [Beijerinckiaceae bacterium]